MSSLPIPGHTLEPETATSVTAKHNSETSKEQPNMLVSKADSETTAVNTDNEKPEPIAEYVAGVKLAVIVAAVSIASFLMLLDTMIVSTAIPRITDDFHSLADVGWYASAYQFGHLAPAGLTGRVYTHFNTKWAFLVFFAIFEIGSALCGAAVSSAMLIVGRFVAGLGAAGIANGSITIVSSCAPIEKRPALLGITMGSFYVNLPAGALAAAAMVVLHIPEQQTKQNPWSLLPRIHHHLDLVGFVLFAPAILMLLLALQFGGESYAWNSSQVIGLFCGSVAVFIVWFFWNRYRGDEAMIPYSIISRRDVLASGVYEAFLMSAVYGGIYYLPIYFQAVNNASAMMSGVYLLPMILAQLFMAGAAGGAGSGLYSILRPGSPTGEWVGFQIIAGFGSGAGLQLAIMAVQAALAGEELSSGIAFVMLTQALGPTVTLTLFNVLFSASLKSGIRQHVPNADATAIINAGATAFRNVVDPADLDGVVIAYADSLNNVFYLVAGLAAVCIIPLWGMGWYDLRKKEEDPAAQGQEKVDGSLA
ncbi:hypothetical protein Daus18300_013508 [Diaporthe australafricana]|uniref:Major facilitator superfamily (MFS) profile domain-containing protein n=1 Tax=Diaporthe australafricana TaxID=127596 RepID=A0ABR3VYQ0_9PEZI